MHCYAEVCKTVVCFVYCIVSNVCVCVCVAGYIQTYTDKWPADPDG